MALYTGFLAGLGGFILAIVITIVMLLLFNTQGPSFLSIAVSVSITAFIILIPGGLFCGIIPYWIWPKFRTTDRSSIIESALPTTASYMSAMAAAGVPPTKIFASLAKQEMTKEITDEAMRITRDVEIFGLDILRALTAGAYRSPSDQFSGFLEGIHATITSGGDLTQYLASEAETLMKRKEEDIKKFIDDLGISAEIFMVLGVVAPLFLVVAVAIIAILPLGIPPFAIVAFLMFATYLGVPLVMAFMLIWVDALEKPE